VLLADVSDVKVLLIVLSFLNKSSQSCQFL